MDFQQVSSGSINQSLPDLSSTVLVFDFYYLIITMVEETKAQNTQKNVQYYVELGKKIVMETRITGDVSQDNFIKGFSFR